MNERHPYDKSLGDKLNNLPVPDVQKSWQEMQVLLDHEMPQGRSKRRGGWWFPGAMILVLIMSTALIFTMNLSPQNGDPPTAAGKGQNSRMEESKTVNEEPVADDKILREKQLENSSEAGPEANVDKTLDAERTEQPGRVSPGRGKTTQNDLLVKAAVSATKGQVRPGLQGKAPGYSTEQAKAETGGSDNDISANNLAADKFVATNGQDEIRPTNNFGIQPLYSLTGFIHDTIDLDQRLTVQYAKVDRKFLRAHRRQYKPANVRAPYSTKGRTFALGLSLPLGFPLGDQKMLGYNAAGGPNTTSDYIPSVHLQYHFNPKSYIQAEFQAMSPQYIRPVMVYHKEYNTPVSHTSSSIYARKLYYLNLPVSVHYSPFRHFYLGTGLQLSSMLSGVAQHEKVRTGLVSSDSIYQSTYAKFGNDSIGSRMRGTELRVLLDANYYWNRFTVGLRYTQAVNNYISMRASPTSPYVFDKNKSLQFYLRFNLWEWKKREALHEKILTFK